MTEVIVLLALGIGIAFAGVLWFGAPYLPTLAPQIAAAFELLHLQKGSTLLELGCGDGKVLIAAAEHGYCVIGIELNPILAFIAWVRTRRYGKQVRVIWGNFWKVSWPHNVDGVYVFLLDAFMTRLDERMVHYKKPLASVAFRIPGRHPASQKDGVFLYRY